jgi:malonyl CoA-acyl carrier protein transacylase
MVALMLGPLLAPSASDGVNGGVNGGVGAATQSLRTLLERACAEAAAKHGKGAVAAVAAVNSPSQAVLSGHLRALEDAVAILKGPAMHRICRRAVRLPVSAPFHCPLMQPAAERMRLLMERGSAGFDADLYFADDDDDDDAQSSVRRRDIDWAQPLFAAKTAPPSSLAVPLVSNASARAERDLGRISALLVESIAAPVRWLECMHAAVDEAAGAPGHALQPEAVTVWELGSGSTLTSLLKQQFPGPSSMVVGLAVGTSAEVSAALNSLEKHGQLMWGHTWPHCS